MEISTKASRYSTGILSKAKSLALRFLFLVLSTGPIPTHLSFILDGNRRYARKRGLSVDVAYSYGFNRLVSLLPYFRGMGVTHVSAYAFSIENFNRTPDEVRHVMDLVRDGIDCLLRESAAVDRLGVRVRFVGTLHLLDDNLRARAEQLMEASRGNDRLLLLVCIAYTSTDEIRHGVQECAKEARRGVADGSRGPEEPVRFREYERHSYLGEYPPVDVLVRTSGETRLSNFLLMQSAPAGILYSPRCLWPEIGLRHIVWAVLLHQRNFLYTSKMRARCHAMSHSY